MYFFKRYLEENRMKHSRKMTPIHIYVASTFFFSFLFFMDSHFPSIPMFGGSTTIMYGFLYFVGMTGDNRDPCFALFLSISILLLIFGLITTYLLAWYAQKYIPFVVVVGVNILLTVGIICYAIYSGFNALVLKMSVETAINSVYLIWMIWFLYKKRPKERT